MLRSVLLLVMLASCRVGTMSPEEFDRAYPVGRLTTLSPVGMRESLAELRNAIGGRVRATSVSFSEGRTTVLAQNPRIPANFDSYTYWRGDVTSSPMKVDRDDEQRMISRLFDLDSVPFDRLPGLARDALVRLPIEGAHVSNVSIDRNGDGPLEIDVSLQSERRSGRVTYDGNGAFVSATPD